MSEGNTDPFFCSECGAQLYPESKYCPQCGSKRKINAPDRDLQLFQVYSIINKFRYHDVLYDNLKITWFIKDRENAQVPFEKVIMGYSDLCKHERVFPENYIKELFTKEEAEQLQQYLLKMEKTAAYLELSNLPINGKVKGYNDTSMIEGMDFFRLYRRPLYNLPFKVKGIFNVKIADEHVESDDRITVITDVSAWRKQLKDDDSR